jgi:Concanavalin A-like lectin/glucanases superfamily
VFTAGHSSLGGGIPTWAPDRKGIAGKALHFTKGGHVLVPSNAAFGPTEMTISLWIKMDSLNTADCTALNGRCTDGVFADNYMISQNSYLGYKFQTQEGKKPFYTVKTATDVYINEDSNDGVIQLKKWYAVAVTFKTGEMTFYINGQQVRQVTGLTGGFVPLAERFDFVIGQELPNAKVDPAISWILPHFEGFMDEVRIYKKVLTGAQISSIYDQEKP